MKRIIRSTLSLLLLMGILTSSLLAAHAEGIEPRYTGISSLSACIDISSSGGAECNGTVMVRDGYTADLTISLKQDGTTIKSWTESDGTGLMSLTRTYYVPTGHEYYVKTSVTVYNSDGKIVEVQSQDSLHQVY